MVEAVRVFYRLVMSNPPESIDFLSQADRREPPPRDDPEFLRRWAGLSVFDSLAAIRRLGEATRWRRGAYIAELHIPEDAAIQYEGPDRKGHWLLYGADPLFLLGCVVRVVHGPSGAGGLTLIPP